MTRCAGVRSNACSPSSRARRQNSEGRPIRQAAQPSAAKRLASKMRGKIKKRATPKKVKKKVKRGVVEHASTRRGAL